MQRSKNDNRQLPTFVIAQRVFKVVCRDTDTEHWHQVGMYRTYSQAQQISEQIESPRCQARVLLFQPQTWAA